MRSLKTFKLYLIYPELYHVIGLTDDEKPHRACDDPCIIHHNVLKAHTIKGYNPKLSSALSITVRNTHVGPDVKK